MLTPSYGSFYPVGTGPDLGSCKDLENIDAMLVGLPACQELFRTGVAPTDDGFTILERSEEFEQFEDPLVIWLFAAMGQACFFHALFLSNPLAFNQLEKKPCGHFSASGNLNARCLKPGPPPR